MAVVLTGSVGAGGVNKPADVRNVQILLNVCHRITGRPAAALVVDGLSGPKTVAAIRDVQANVPPAGPVDGRVDPGGQALAKLNTLAATLDVTVVQPGDPTKTHPYTIAVVSNNALETVSGGGSFIPDPIQLAAPAFHAAAGYVTDVLFGRLPGQKENLLAGPAIGPKIRVVKVFLAGLPPTDANALVAQYGVNITEPRRDKFAAYLALFGVTADVAYAITASATHNRAAAWYTTDDPTRGTVPYTLDGAARVTSKFCRIPGTVALHTTSASLTGLHEFGHAFSSFTEGAVTDQYVDSSPDLNVKHGRPIPATFGTFDGTTYASDPVRDGIGYDAGWVSYHPALTDLSVPSLMDNYWAAAAPKTPLDCRFDTITTDFIVKRLAAKMSRP
jgi:peptidoglycan hydrolase-like protein with peptidoglycan-binding domain